MGCSLAADRRPPPLVPAAACWTACASRLPTTAQGMSSARCRPDRGALRITLNRTAVRIENNSGGGSGTDGSTHQHSELMGAAALAHEAPAQWPALHPPADALLALSFCSLVSLFPSPSPAGVGVLPPATLPMAFPSEDAYKQVQVRKHRLLAVSCRVQLPVNAGQQGCASDQRRRCRFWGLLGGQTVQPPHKSVQSPVLKGKQALVGCMRLTVCTAHYQCRPTLPC